MNTVEEAKVFSFRNAQIWVSKFEICQYGCEKVK